MNGDELKQIFEQLDERGRRSVAVVALTELKHAREGLQKARRATLEVQTYNLTLEGHNDQIEGRDDQIEGC